MGSRMVPLETALVSSYRPSIVMFRLSLRISEILSILCSSTPLFPHPTSSLRHISPRSPVSRWMTFWATKSEDNGQIVREISFQDFQPMWSGLRIHQHHRRTDGQTDDMQSQYRAMHYSASRGNEDIGPTPEGAVSRVLRFKAVILQFSRTVAERGAERMRQK